MSAKEMQNLEVKTITHYWGYREIDSSEFKYVGGGDNSDGGNTGDGGDYGGDEGDSGGTNVADTGGAGTGGKGCTAADTQASCAARAEGYAICDALGFGIQGAAALTGNKDAQSLAAQVGPTCRSAVDNVVDAAYRTDMYENRNQMSFSPSLYSYDGSN